MMSAADWLHRLHVIRSFVLHQAREEQLSQSGDLLPLACLRLGVDLGGGLDHGRLEIGGLTGQVVISDLECQVRGDA